MLRKALLTLLLITASPAFAESMPMPNIKGNWELVFEDEFKDFDESIWTPNMELDKITMRRSKCFFIKDNVEVEDGNLIITSRKETKTIIKENGKEKISKYTSGYVQSFRKFKFKYGYIEARMKIPTAKGLWPAFWLMPDRSTDPNAPFLQGMRSIRNENGTKNGFVGKGMEIDIMEHLTEWGPNKFHYAAHWDGYGDQLKSFSKSHTIKTSTDNGYHKFGLYWTKNLLVWFADDKEIGRWKNERVADVPMYIIFNTNMGGWATDKIADKALPEKTLIDYVRVWEGKLAED